MKGTNTDKFCRTLVELLIVACLIGCLAAPGVKATHTSNIQDRCSSGLPDDAPALADRPKNGTG